MSAHLAELLSAAAEQSPDRVAMVEPVSGRRLTWSELDTAADGFAGGLSGLGMVAGYRIALALPNRVELVVAYLGALRAGLVVVPVNPRATTGDVVRLLVDCGARAVLADRTALATVRQAVAGLQDALVGAEDELRRSTAVPRVVALGAPTLPGETGYEELLALDGRRPPTAPDPERLATLLYTSGTSGRPRGAMLSHRALLANVEQVGALDPPMLTDTDVVLGVLPLFHVYGLNAVLGQVLARRARLVLVDGFDIEPTLAVIAAEGVSVLPVAPPAFAYWQAVQDLGDRLRGVRLVLSGSAPLSPELVGDFTARTGLRVHQGYGLTEAAPVVTSTLHSVRRGDGRVKPGSVGATLPGIELRLVDEDGRAPVSGDPGEIWLRGRNLFSGYWPDGADGPGTDGWYATGDVGLVDHDGDLFLVDRVKEVVVVSGFNVYPTEVEDVITSLDCVEEAAVIGAANAVTGQSVVAYVRAGPAAAGDPAEVASQVRDRCSRQLARFKWPTEVHVVDTLPYTGTGKVAKGRLRDGRRRGTLGLLE